MPIFKKNILYFSNDPIIFSLIYGKDFGKNNGGFIFICISPNWKTNWPNVATHQRTRWLPFANWPIRAQYFWNFVITQKNSKKSLKKFAFFILQHSPQSKAVQKFFKYVFFCLFFKPTFLQYLRWLSNNWRIFNFYREKNLFLDVK